MFAVLIFIHACITMCLHNFVNACAFIGKHFSARVYTFCDIFMQINLYLYPKKIFDPICFWKLSQVCSNAQIKHLNKSQ